MKPIFAALMSASVLLLSACGFTPLYSTEGVESTGPIQIAQIDGFGGHELRKELLLLLRPGVPGVESGTLVISYEEETRDFQLRPAGLTSRTRISGMAEYELTTPKGVIKGNVTGVANIAASDTPYADISARREASAKAAIDAAQRLADELFIKAGQPEAYRSLSEDS